MSITNLAKATAEEFPAKNQLSYRILVVDDNEACAKVTMWAMETLGHVAQVAFDGPTAIALAKFFQPEVVLLDIGIPVMNGYEICQAMHKEPILQNTVFIAHTGWGQEEHRMRSKEAGFDYHLVKPLKVEAFKDILSLVDKETNELGIKRHNNTVHPEDLT
jgi:CheY-like chemotaxis protein